MTRRIATVLLLGFGCLCLVGCGRAGGGRPRDSGAAPTLARWAPHEHARGVVDLSAPGPSRAIIVAAAGRLLVLGAGGRLRPFARAYSAPRGLEPYIARSDGQRVRAGDCRFARNGLYALRLNHGDGVTQVDARGHVRRFARLPRRGLENGIAFDGTGRFGHRLLVTAVASARTTVYAIDCNGHVRVLTTDGPRVEGGLAVAPSTFGRFAGDLIAPDELSGKLYAIGPNGDVRLVAMSGLPHGQDVGVESLGFVPRAFTDALVADRRTRRNRHPGDDQILSISHATLSAAGVGPGTLLAVSEGGAATIAVSCSDVCRVRPIARGPAIAHIEGHVVFSAVRGH